MRTHFKRRLGHPLSPAGLAILDAIGKNDFLVLGEGPYYIARSDRLRTVMVDSQFDIPTVQDLLSWGYLYRKAITHELRATPLGLAARDIERKRLRDEAKRLERAAISQAELDRIRAAYAVAQDKPRRQSQMLEEWNETGRAEAMRAAETRMKAIKEREDAARAARKATTQKKVIS